jgi:hypothetical protein
VQEVKSHAGQVEAGAREAQSEAILAAWFDAFYERWLPRIYHYAAARLADPARAEVATRAVLMAALRAGIADGEDAIARQLLSLLKAELVREGQRTPARVLLASTQDQRRA